MSNNLCLYRLIHDKKIPKFEELKPDNFIWIPLTSIPINEHYRVNSMAQPALKIFPLLSWTAVAPFATDEQKYLQKLALKHKEMGYFLLHYKKVFGIIGVTEYYNGKTPGRAVIFNCVDQNDYYDEDNPEVMLNLVYSKVQYPCKSLVYKPGAISNYDSIYHESYHGPESFDD